MAVINEKLTRILPTADHPDGPPQVSTVDKPLQVVYQSIILQFSAPPVSCLHCRRLHCRRLQCIGWIFSAT